MRQQSARPGPSNASRPRTKSACSRRHRRLIRVEALVRRGPAAPRWSAWGERLDRGVTRDARVEQLGPGEARPVSRPGERDQAGQRRRHQAALKHPVGRLGQPPLGPETGRARGGQGPTARTGSCVSPRPVGGGQPRVLMSGSRPLAAGSSMVRIGTTASPGRSRQRGGPAVVAARSSQPGPC